MTKASTAKKPVLIHESEVQRQHVRIQIPAGIRIGKNTYRIKDLSAGGLCIKTEKNFRVENVGNEGTLLFPFENFSFNLRMKLKPVYNLTDKKIAGFRFEDMTPRQISMIHHVVKSYLSGLLTSEEDILAIAARNNFVNTSEEDESNDNYSKNIFSRVMSVIAISMAGMLGLLLLFSNIYENNAIVKSYVGIVEGNLFTARAQDNGNFYSLLAKGTEQVAKGQPIAVIKTAGMAGAPGQTGNITIESPCDCLIAEQFPRDGEFIAMGEPIFRLQPINDYMWVTASLEPEQIHRLQLQDGARIKIAGESEFIEGNVTEFVTPHLNRELIQVKIRTKKTIPSTLSGRLAYVEFLIH